MELLYIWIKNYKGIREVGLNLSNEYRFKYHEKVKKVTITKSKNFIPNFFAHNISNLTAIIGENGSGKTSALRYIIEYLSGGIHNHQDEEGIVFYKVGEQINYYSPFDIEILMPEVKKPLIKISDSEKIRSSSIVIFASNNFDPTSYYSRDFLNGQLGETKNLSTWHLLYSDFQNRTGENAFHKNLTYEDRFSAFASQEFIRMVRLLRWLNIQETKERPFPVVPPPFLNLKLVFSSNEKYIGELNVLSKELSKYFNISKSSKNKFLLQAFLASLYHFINEIKFISGPNFISDTYKKLPNKILDFLKGRVYNNNREISIISELHDIFYFILGDKEFEILNERISKMQSFLNKLNDFIHKRNIKISGDFKLISVELSKANKAALEELIEEYYKEEQISGFADFYFSHTPEGESTISSGEYAMLILFARLNSIKIDSRKPLIILIDEAELALHPQWQKEFIYHFTDFISERFASHKIQVVLTAHSPFILSDMPTNCVVLLKKGIDKSIVMKSLDNKQETFGANIHELFTESFFLQNGLMGEFARNKISALIEEINSVNRISKEDYENKYKSRIEIIGEPFIQSKLYELVARKTDNNVIDSIIEELQKIKKRNIND